MRVEIERFPDGRLKVLARFLPREDSNFWKHKDGSFTWVFKEEEINRIIETFLAIDTFNVAGFLRKYVKSKHEEG